MANRTTKIIKGVKEVEDDDWYIPIIDDMEVIDDSITKYIEVKQGNNRVFLDRRMTNELKELLDIKS